MGSWQLVIRAAAFQASWWFTWMLTCQKGALECGPGTPHPAGSRKCYVALAGAGPPTGMRLQEEVGWRWY